MANRPELSQNEVVALQRIWDLINEKRDVTLTGRNAADLGTRGLESVPFRRTGSIAGSTTETLIDISGRECHLEALAYGSNVLNGFLRFLAYEGDGETSNIVMNVPTKDGASVLDIDPNVLQIHWDGENDFFKNFVYDEANSTFTMGMKRQARFGNGVRITVTNPSSSARNISVSGMIFSYRE